MYIPGVSDLYKVISSLVYHWESNAKDEIEALDKIFGITDRVW